MIDLLVSFSHDQVINNKICLARLLLECRKNKKIYDWMDKVFDQLVKEEEHDLLVILEQAFENDQEKRRVV